ncbi:MAG: D-sedoheptulose-7-phosphate isomerase [Bacteroidota bacterium]
MSRIRTYFEELAELQGRVYTQSTYELLQQAARQIAGSFKSGGRLFVCGNGGSMADAIHFAEELSGRFRDDRPPYPAISISDVGHISCVANDYGYDQVFRRYLKAHAKEGDVLVAISTSGNSQNVLLAAEWAQVNDVYVIALTGKDGGKLAAACDLELRVPHDGYADHIQELHIQFIHAIILEIEALMGT